jgi:CelD/BcsL family acetyltransferase involved in cellulose biosynthesis
MAGSGEKTRVSVVEDLGAEAAAWDALVDFMPIPSPFLRSWWLSTAAGALPQIVLVHSGDRLVGGVALEGDRHLGVERLRVLGAGSLCPDHIDAVAAADSRGEATRALRAWLERPGDRLVDLDGLVSGSELSTALAARARHERAAVAPWVSLAGGYLDSRSANLRRLVARTEHRLAADAGQCDVVRLNNVEEGLTTLRMLHARRWGDGSAFLGSFARFAAVCRAAEAAGELAINILRAGDEIISVVASFEVAGRISHYQSGRSPTERWRNASTVLLARVCENAAGRGLGEADFLRGNEAYKDRLTDRRRDLWRLRCAIGPRAVVALHSDIAAERGRDLAGRARRELFASVARPRPRIRTVPPPDG